MGPPLKPVPLPVTPSTTPPAAPAQPRPVPVTVQESQPRIAASIQLPSRGKLYPDCPDGVVEVYPMTGREEALVAGLNRENSIEVFDILLGRCIKKAPPIPEILSTDKYFLMLVLRANSYGMEFGFFAKCPECGARKEYVKNIPDDFEVRELSDGFTEPVLVTLPKCGTEVGFRFLRGKDEEDITRYVRREESKDRGPGAGSPGFLYRLAKQIVTLNGKTVPHQEIMRFLESALASDLSVLKDTIDEVTPGFITVLTLGCLKCGGEFRFDVTLNTGEFFRTYRRRKGTTA